MLTLMTNPIVGDTQLDPTMTQTWLGDKMDEDNENEKKKAEGSTGASPPPKKAKTSEPSEPLSAKLEKLCG